MTLVARFGAIQPNKVYLRMGFSLSFKKLWMPCKLRPKCHDGLFYIDLIQGNQTINIKANSTINSLYCKNYYIYMFIDPYSLITLDFVILSCRVNRRLYLKICPRVTWTLHLSLIATFTKTAAKWPHYYRTGLLNWLRWWFLLFLYHMLLFTLVGVVVTCYNVAVWLLLSAAILLRVCVWWAEVPTQARVSVCRGVVSV